VDVEVSWPAIGKVLSGGAKNVNPRDYAGRSLVVTVR
jgi:hypothetical protein